MTDRKEELKKSKEAGESIVAKQEPATTTKSSEIKEINHEIGRAHV